MDFAWTPEQDKLRTEVVAFSKTELNDGLDQRDRESEFARDSWLKCARFGLLGAYLPKKYGGQGHDLLTTVAILEGLGYGCRDAGLTLAINALIWTIMEPISIYGNEAQKAHFLPALARGELLAADAISEPEAGSDALAMKTRAHREGDHYVVNGRKAWVGQAPNADLILLFAKTNPNAGSWGISVFLVDPSLPGITRSENQEKMGLRTIAMGDIELRDCLVPENARLGPEGIGAALFNRSAEYERCFIQASNVGAMERQLEEAIEYAQSRKQFGKPIGDFQAVSHRVADMRVRLETARLFLYKAAWEVQNGEYDSLRAAMTKLVISENFLQSSLDAVRIHGAKGYATAFGIEKDLRDAMGSTIYAGTSDIQRNLIARNLGL